jgi:hypothetical protein
MTWIRPSSKGLVIVAYFFVATVWIPDRVARSQGLPNEAKDMLVVLVWATGLALGMWLLRRAQRRGMI